MEPTNNLAEQTSVDGIFVDSNVQGRGIGKMLLDAALPHFQELLS